MTTTPTASDRAMSFLIHGASKSGKSSLSVTGPSPRVYCDVESAGRFLAIKPIRWDPMTEAPPVPDGTWDTAIVATRDWPTIERVYQWLNSGQHPFRSLVIDSVSELQQRYIEGKAGRVQMTQQNWGDAFRAVSGLIRDIRDLTMHPTKPIECVVMTAMTKQLDGMWKPWLQGQVQTVLPYLVDVCGYLYAEQEFDELSGETREVRNLLTRRTSQFEAGERVDGRIPTIVRVSARAPGQPGRDLEAIINMVFGNAPTEATTTTATAEAASAEGATT